MSDDLIVDGDLWNALRRLFQRGIAEPAGRRMPGSRTCSSGSGSGGSSSSTATTWARRWRTSRRSWTTVLQTEREGIERQVPDRAQRAQKHEPLDQLPADPAGRIKQLQDYDFIDPEAERLFQELMKSLQQQMLQPFMQGMKQSLQNMSAGRSQADARDDARPQPHAAGARRGRRAGLRGVQAQVGAELPGRREPRPAPGADRPAGRPDAVAAGEHVARAAPAAPGDDASRSS